MANTPEPQPTEAGDGDDMRRKFREALQHKQAHHAPDQAAGGPARGVGPAANDKHTRQFRRKSG